MDDLRRLLLLRLLVVLGPVFMLFWLCFGLTPPQPLPLWAVGLFLALSAPAFIAPYWRVRSSALISTWELFAYLQLDVLALAWLLYFSGGASNPFVSLLLLPLLIAATLLPMACIWAMAGVTTAIYTGLMFHYLPLPGLLSGHGPGFHTHLWGMWLVFVITALLVAGFVARLAAVLHQRDREVARLREKALRDEQILALGMFAAGAAHELGTPLSTIAVLTKELEHEYSAKTALRADLRTLREQVEACKVILGELLRAADLSTDHNATQPLDQLLERTRARWQLLRPWVPLRVHCAGSPPPPNIPSPQAVGQTLISLLNNAADACPDGVDLVGRWDSCRVLIEIRDRGPGPLAEAEAGQLFGKGFFSTKEDGMGIGLLLANATLERLGGRVTLSRDPQGGTCTRIDLPAQLTVA